MKEALRIVVYALCLCALVFASKCLSGCGGQAFTTLDVAAVDAGDLQVESDAGDDAAAIAPTADAGDEDAHMVMTRAADDGAGDASQAPLEHDATPDVAASPVDDAAPPVCEPDRCPPCTALQGYACCTGNVCGCENPSQGGACR